MMGHRWHILCASVLALGVLALIPRAVGAADPRPLEVPVGTWKELPGTKLKGAWAEWGQPEFLPQGAVTGASSMITAWNSGALDTKRGLFVMPRGGGHADWAGNQVIAFDVNALTWRLLRPPSPNYPRMTASTPGSAYINPYSDGTPASVHTYDAVEYLPTVDRVWSAGGIIWSPGGESVPPKTWWWNPTSTEWEPKVTRPGGYGTSATWVPFLDRLIVRTSQALYSYDPATDAYKELFRFGLPGLSSTMALDDSGRKLFRFVNGKFAAIDLRNPSAKETLGDLTGDTSFSRLVGIGAFFDKGKVMVFGAAADTSRGALHVVDPAKRVAARYDPPDDVHPPAPTRQGMWKRFFEARGHYWVITQWNENVWVFNPGPQGVSPTPSPPRAEPESGPPSRPLAAPAAPPAPSPAPPPGSSPLPNLQPRSWLGVPLTVLGESKHARLTYDSRRKLMVLAGGDGTDGSGNSYTGQNVFTLNLATGSSWVKIHGKCPAPGELIPPTPDNVTWAYDPKRDQGVIMPAYYGAASTGCPPAYNGAATGATTTTSLVDSALPTLNAQYVNYMVRREIKFEGNVTTALKNKTTTVTTFTPNSTTLNFKAISITINNGATEVAPAMGDRYTIANDEPSPKMGWVFNFASNSWARGPWPLPVSGSGRAAGWGGDLHDHFGVLDPVTDTVYRATNLGCGVQIIPLDGSQSSCIAFTYPNAPAGSWDPSNDQSAIDVEGRMIYWIARYKRQLVKWSIDKRKTVELIPLPSTWVAPTSDYGGGDFETHLAFDTKNRVLMHTNDNGYGQGTKSTTYPGTMIDQTTGQNRGVYFFNVDTKQWEWEPAPTDRPVNGNVLGYDPANNVFIYVGRSSENPSRYWIYRYK